MSRSLARGTAVQLMSTVLQQNEQDIQGSDRFQVSGPPLDPEILEWTENAALLVLDLLRLAKTRTCDTAAAKCALLTAVQMIDVARTPVSK
jgi:hypothetical protein